ncbi:MAG: stability/partitioning determinant [Geminicoccaceae bacterium]
MGKERTSLGFGDELDELDPKTWAPKPTEAKPRPPRDALEQATKAAGFQSREPQPEQPIRQQRRARRTGRTEQFTTKTTPDYRALIYEIADGKVDGHQRLVGEVLEQAVDALLREIAPERVG